MSGDDYSEVFGARSFAERIANPAPAPEAKESIAGSSDYKPYGYMPNGMTESCDVQRWIEGTEKPTGIEFQYRFLVQIGYIGEEQIKLFLPDSIVTIDGSNLRDLRKKLARRQVTFIQQYSSRVWPTLPPKGEPIIASIKIMRLDNESPRNDD